MFRPRKVRVSSWEEAKALGGQLRGWVFRGQADSNWRLISTLERALWPDFEPFGEEKKLLDALFGDNRQEIEYREKVLLREFQRRAFVHLKALPADDALLDWFSLMQHYGCVTRLLDFSRSFYVAAYFAVENALGVSAVWCIDPKWLHNTEATFIDYDQLQEAERERAARVLAGEGAGEGMVCVEPFRLDERIAAQQGLHLIGCDAACSFEHNLCSALGSTECLLDELDWQAVSPEELVETEAWSYSLLDAVRDPMHKSLCLLKIELPGELHRSAIYDLQAMNVTAASLFPGLEGFARSLNLQTRFPSLHEVFEEARVRNRVLKGAGDGS